MIMNENTTIETKGFCLYIDTLQTAFKILPTMEERGQLLTNIYQYVSNEKVDNFSERISTVFMFLQNSINIANSKYLKRKKAQKEYYDKVRQKSVLSDYNNKDNNTNNNTNKDNNNNTNTDKDNRDNNNNTDKDNDNNTDKDIIIDNISFPLRYNKYKYTLPEIKERIEKAGYILKENYIKDFYILNSENFNWKYSPECAVLAYVERHPNALKEKNTTPQPPAVPRTDVDLAKAAQMAEEHRRAVTLWNSINKAMLGKGNTLTDKQKQAICNAKPMTARMITFSKYSLMLQVANKSDIQILETTPQFFDVVKSSHVSKLEYKIFLSDN